jgi:hypothetical protein
MKHLLTSYKFSISNWVPGCVNFYVPLGIRAISLTRVRAVWSRDIDARWYELRHILTTNLDTSSRDMPTTQVIIPSSF